MGFGKFLFGAIGVAGAIIAAPVVLPAAAAVAAAGAGLAAAGAGAVAAGAAAVGSAVGATAVGGAALSGAAAVGSVATAGVTAIGGAVGTAAGAVGLSSVAAMAPATLGAGTIAAASGVYGTKQLVEASEIVKAAQARYEKKKSSLDEVEAKTNEIMEKTGQLKAEIWSSFEAFTVVLEKIKGCRFLEAEHGTENIYFSMEDLAALKGLSISASLLQAGTVGALASFAAFGRNAINLGSIGLPGGRLALSSIAAAPALAIAGIFLAFKGHSKMEEAQEISEKADKAIRKMDKGIAMLKKLSDLSSLLNDEMRSLYKYYRGLLEELREIVEHNTNFKMFSSQEQKRTELCILSAKVLKRLTTTDLLMKKGDETEVNSSPVKEAISEAEGFMAKATSA
jgi:hypothetical protein